MYVYCTLIFGNIFSSIVTALPASSYSTRAKKIYKISFKKMVFENSVPTTMYLVIINVHVHVANEGCEEIDILKDYSNS